MDGENAHVVYQIFFYAFSTDDTALTYSPTWKLLWRLVGQPFAKQDLLHVNKQGTKYW